MNQTKKNIVTKENGLFDVLIFRLLPYWPLLVLFLIICFAGAVTYLKIALPTYEASATLLVKDERKGSDDSRMMESLNIFGSKKIVENEIEVLRSRALMKEVVKTLRLYSPVYMEKGIRSVSAYTISPVNVEVKDPEKIIESQKIYFSFDDNNKLVKIGNTTYAIDQWVNTSYGELKFTLNNRIITSNDPLYFSLIPLKKSVGGLIGRLGVTAPNKLSSIVNLHFVDEVPKKAEDILNELINAYNRAGINDKNFLVDNTMQFVEERLKHVKVEMDSIENQIQQYRSGQKAVNLSEQSTLFLRQVGDNDQRVALISMQLAVLDQVQKYVNSGKSNANIVPSTMGITDPVLAQLLQRLSNAEIEYDKLKHTTAENNPVLISLSNELERIKPNILENIRVQRINLIASRKNLNETNKKYSDNLQSIPEKERRLLEISRQQTIINKVYDFLLQKKEETALSYASTVPDSRILDVAESSMKPVSPQKGMAFGVALAIAFLLTFIVVFVKDFSNSKILFRSEMNTLSVFPVVGEVAYVKGEIEVSKKKEFINQQFYEIIASMELFSKNNSIKKILVTSSIAGEGKSFVSLQLAKSLAEAGKKIVLVDLDLKNSTLSKNNKSSKGPGLTDFLKGEAEAFDLINPTEFNNVFLVKAGDFNASNYAVLFSNDRLAHLFSYLEPSFDFVILDTSSLDPVSDTLILTQFSDAILYVTRHAFTTKSLFQLQVQKKSLDTLNNVGIIFNGVKARGFFKGYSYGYDNINKYKDTSHKKNSTIVKKELIKQA